MVRFGAARAIRPFGGRLGDGVAVGVGQGGRPSRSQLAVENGDERGSVPAKDTVEVAPRCARLKALVQDSGDAIDDHVCDWRRVDSEGSCSRNSSAHGGRYGQGMRLPGCSPEKQPSCLAPR